MMVQTPSRVMWTGPIRARTNEPFQDPASMSSPSPVDLDAPGNDDLTPEEQRWNYEARDQVHREEQEENELQRTARAEMAAAAYREWEENVLREWMARPQPKRARIKITVSTQPSSSSTCPARASISVPPPLNLHIEQVWDIMEALAKPYRKPVALHMIATLNAKQAGIKGCLSTEPLNWRPLPGIYRQRLQSPYELPAPPGDLRQYWGRRRHPSSLRLPAALCPHGHGTTAHRRHDAR